MHAKIDHNDLLKRMNKMGFTRVSCLPSYAEFQNMTNPNDFVSIMVMEGKYSVVRYNQLLVESEDWSEVLGKLDF